MTGKRRHLKYSDAGNAIIDEMMSSGIQVHAYLDGLLREADSAWRGSVARLRSEGWTVGLYDAAMTALGPVDGNETAAIVCNRLAHCANLPASVTVDEWKSTVGRATKDTAILRSLLLLSRAHGRGLGPLLRNAMGAA